MGKVNNLIATILVAAGGLLIYTVHFSDFAEYLLEDYMEIEGDLSYDKQSKTILLNTTSAPMPHTTAEKALHKNSPVFKLQFAFDDPSDLIIEDFGKVVVKGYFSRIHGVLMVEDMLELEAEML